MGMHFGVVAAKTSLERLRQEFLAVWPQFDLAAAAGDLPDEAALEAWKQTHEEFVSAADCTKERPGKTVFSFWQDGPWALLWDRSYVHALDEDALTTLSARIGTVLSFVVETASGCADFRCFENGTMRRKIANVDGEIELSGQPLPEEAGIDVANYYMQETEDLWRAFGLTPLDDMTPPTGGYSAICVIDRTDYTELPTKIKSPAQPPPDQRDPQRPWWRFW